MNKVLEIKHCNKSFGENEVLKDISLSVTEGQVVSIIGPSGSGKSTLLRCATMLETMDGGDLIYLETMPQRRTHRARRFMPQRKPCRASKSILVWCSRILICFPIIPS